MSGRVSYLGGIVKDGLILDLDAGKLDSYNRLGTTWNDISGNGNNGSLTNFSSPSPQTIWNGDNGGSIVFDGINDFVSSTLTLTTLNNISFSIWYKWNGINQVNILSYYGNASLNGFGFYMNDGTNSPNPGNKISVLYGGSFYNVLPTSATLTTQWNYLLITRTSTTLSFYSNGVLIGSTNTLPNSGVSYNFYSCGVNGSTPNAAGNVSNVLFYNRALSASEVLQNYNAIKGRYI